VGVVPHLGDADDAAVDVDALDLQPDDLAPPHAGAEQ